jgi:starch-binding outer membrane protein, SusD/RagB family
MKTLKYIFLYLSVLATLSSCSDFLDKQMQGSLSSESFFQNEKDAISSLTAVYSDLKDTRYHRSIWSIGDVLSDNATASGSDGDIAAAVRMESFNYHSDWSRLLDRWTVCYRALNKSNQSIEGISNMNENLFKTISKSQLLGEAYFLRAYFHFEVVRTWGDAPIVDRVPKVEDKNKTRSPKAEVYEFIESDLIKATKLLTKKSQLGQSNLGRASSGSAYSLLAKVYLYDKKYEEARIAAKAVIDMGESEYKLFDNFEDNFNLKGENGSESIFEIDFYKSQSETTNYLTNGNYSCYAMMPRPFAGYGGNQALQSLVNAFEPGDKRLKATVLTVADMQGVESQSDLAQLVYNRTGYYNKKFYLPPKDRVGTGIFTLPLNTRIIRLAEVYLIYAEACCKKNDDITARIYLNKVRTRAGLKDNTTDSGDALYNAILKERRIELAMEGDRFFDLVRTGKAAEAFSSLEFKTYKPQANFKLGISELLPIPQLEIENSNGNIKQNPL